QPATGYTVQTGANNPLDALGTAYSGTQAGNFITGDFNGDGLTDVEIGRASCRDREKWRDDANGTFNQRSGAANPFAAVTLGSAADFVSNDLMVGDWDADGDIEILN